MNTRELVDYYADLLILQYVGKIRAYATIQTQATPVVMPQVSVQTITFDPIPTSGEFTLFYNGVESAPINWNSEAAEIQDILRALAGSLIDGGDAETVAFETEYDGGTAITTVWLTDIDGGDAEGFDLSGIVVTGSVQSGLITITFEGVDPPAYVLELGENSLMLSGTPVIPVITEIDETLPIAVQNGFNLFGDNIAVGAQLDTLGKYVGVTRTGNGFTSVITLDDDDFLSLIQMAIIKNSAESSLSVIVGLIYQFFGSDIAVFDHKNMRMTFMISEDVGSIDLVQLFITQGILPVPMAVGATVIYAPIVTDFFGFRTYNGAAVNVNPFNDYDDYQEDWPWLSYANAVAE